MEILDIPLGCIRLFKKFVVLWSLDICCLEIRNNLYKLDKYYYLDIKLFGYLSEEKRKVSIENWYIYIYTCNNKNIIFRRFFISNRVGYKILH